MERKKFYIILAVVLFVLFVGFVISYSKKYKDKSSVLASTANIIVSSEDEFNLGQKNNLTVTAAGTAYITDAASDSVEIDTNGMTLNADYAENLVNNAVDNNSGTSWGPISTTGSNHYWQIDFGEEKIINRFVLDAYVYTGAGMFASDDGVTWTQSYPNNITGQLRFTWDETLETYVYARYWRLVVYGGAPYDTPAEIYELSLYEVTPATATHTSAATQLDGTADFETWDSFVPTATIPANTSVGFRFRTSANSVDWSSWSASTPYAASIDLSALAGFSQQRYLQVETTLTSTDGVSTPTLSDYTAFYTTTDPTPDPTCSDGVQNGDETGVDCGGSCGACSTPATPSCSDGIQNQDETGVDTGGVCGTPSPPILPAPEDCSIIDYLTIEPSATTLAINTSSSYTAKAYGLGDRRISGRTFSWSTTGGTIIDTGSGRAKYIAPAYAEEFSVKAQHCGKSITAKVNVVEFIPPVCLGKCGTPGCPPCCVGEDCNCDDDKCVCTGPDCNCSDPDKCKICEDGKCHPCIGDACRPVPCIGSDCRCVGDSCYCEGDDCNCTSEDKCFTCYDPTGKKKCMPCVGDDCKPIAPICIGSFCFDNPLCIGGACFGATTEDIPPITWLPLLVSFLLWLLNPETLTKLTNFLRSIFLKGKDKKRDGIVYDSASGLPVASVLILLFRSRDNKLISTVKSDIDGRFALETPVGEEYFIEIRKTGFNLLSGTKAKIIAQSLAYSNNYFGGDFRPSETESLFSRAVPLVANEKSLKAAAWVRLIEDLSKFMRTINLPVIVFGAVMSILVILNNPSAYNWIVLSIYIVVIVYEIFMLFVHNGRSFGRVYEAGSQRPVDLALIRAISETTGKLVKTTVSNAKGKYTLAVPKGYYKIETSRAGFTQSENISIRVKSAFKPTVKKIYMNPIRGQVLEAENQPLPSAFRLPTSNPQPRTFIDSEEIIEKFREKSGKTEKNSNHPNWEF